MFNLQLFPNIDFVHLGVLYMRAFGQSRGGLRCVCVCEDIVFIHLLKLLLWLVQCNAPHFHYQGKNAGLRIITRQSDVFSNNDPNQSDATER